MAVLALTFNPVVRIAVLLLCSLSLPGQTGTAEDRSDEKPLAETPAALSLEEQTVLIGAARENALRYTKSLPDFLCTQIVSRYTGPDKGAQKLHDTLEMSVAYSGGGEHYKLEKLDGRPTSKSLAKAGGFQSHGEFGSTLQSIFRPESEAEFHWLRWTGLRGRRTHVYSYRIAQNHSTFKINWATVVRQNHMTAGFRGFVFIDAENNQVVRIVSEAEGIPDDWLIRSNYGTLDYGYVDIAGRQFLLPRRAESYLRLKSGQRLNVSEFSRYRRFAGDASISFDSVTP